MAILGPDIGIDTTTGDLKFVDGDLQLVVDPVQAIRIRLLTILGEWFLDPTIGIPYFTNIFVKNPNLDLIRSIFTNEIINTPGVLEVTQMTLDYDVNTRSLTVNWAANTDEDELSDILEVTI